MMWVKACIVYVIKILISTKFVFDILTDTYIKVQKSYSSLNYLNRVCGTLIDWQVIVVFNDLIDLNLKSCVLVCVHACILINNLILFKLFYIKSFMIMCYDFF